jgi:hypothetical protein
LSRPSTFFAKYDVDARHKAGQDEKQRKRYEPTYLQIKISNSQQQRDKLVIASVSEAIHRTAERKDGLLRRFAPRNDGKIHVRDLATGFVRVLL